MTGPSLRRSVPARRVLATVALGTALALAPGSVLTATAQPRPQTSTGYPTETETFDLLAALKSAPELEGFAIDVSELKLRIDEMTQQSASFTEGPTYDFYKETFGQNSTSVNQAYNSPPDTKTDTVSYTTTTTNTIGGGIDVESSWKASILFGSTEQKVKISAHYDYSWSSSATVTKTETITFPAQTIQVPPGQVGIIHEYYTRGTLKAVMQVKGRLVGDVLLTKCGNTLRVPVGQLMSAQRDPGLGPIAPGWITPDGKDAVVNTTSTYVGQAILAYIQMSREDGSATVAEATTRVGDPNPLSQITDSSPTPTPTPSSGTSSLSAASMSGPASTDRIVGSTGPSVGASGSSDGPSHLRDLQACFGLSRNVSGGLRGIALLPNSSVQLVGAVYYSPWKDASSGMHYYYLNGTDLHAAGDGRMSSLFAQAVTSAKIVPRFGRANTINSSNDGQQVDYIAAGKLFTGMARWGLDPLRIARGSATYSSTARAVGQGYVLDGATLTYEGHVVSRAVTDAFASFVDDKGEKDTVYFISGVQAYAATGATVTPDPSADTRYTSAARAVGPGYVLDRGVLYYHGARLTAAPGSDNPVVSAVGWKAFQPGAGATGPYESYAVAITAQGDYLDLKGADIRRTVRAAVPSTATALPGGFVYTGGKVLTDELSAVATGVRWTPVCTVAANNKANSNDKEKGVTCLFSPNLGDVADRPLPEPKPTPVTIAFTNTTRTTQIVTISVNGESRPVAFPPTTASGTATQTNEFDLRSDVNEISFSSAGEGIGVDSVTVNGTVFEAESAYNVAATGTIRKLLPGASGSLVVDRIGRSGGTLSMMLDPAAARTPVTIAYSSPGKWSRLTVTTQGLTQAIALPPTTTPNEIAQATVGVPLLDAASQITFGSDGVSPAIDSITIRSTTIEAEEPLVTRGSGTQITTTSGATPAVLVGSLGTSAKQNLVVDYDPERPAEFPVTMAYANPDTTVRTALVSVNGYEQLVAFAPTGKALGAVTVSMPITTKSITVGIRNPQGWAPLIDIVVADGVKAEAELTRNTIVAPAVIKTIAGASGGIVVGNLGMGKGELHVIVRR